MIALVNFLIWICEKTGRVLTINGTAGEEDVYLIRYYIVRSRFFNIFIHRFLRSDHDDLHDHPWNFCTYVVQGAYTEKRWNEKTKTVESTRRCNFTDNKFGEDNQNTFVFRKATDQHQVLVDASRTLSERKSAPLTICITGPVIRDWGFIKIEPLIGAEYFLYTGNLQNPTKRVWIDWRVYLGLPSNTPSRG